MTPGRRPIVEEIVEFEKVLQELISERTCEQIVRRVIRSQECLISCSAFSRCSAVLDRAQSTRHLLHNYINPNPFSGAALVQVPRNLFTGLVHV